MSASASVSLSVCMRACAALGDPRAPLFFALAESKSPAFERAHALEAVRASCQALVNPQWPGCVWQNFGKDAGELVARASLPSCLSRAALRSCGGPLGLPSVSKLRRSSRMRLEARACVWGCSPEALRTLTVATIRSAEGMGLAGSVRASATIAALAEALTASVAEEERGAEALVEAVLGALGPFDERDARTKLLHEHGRAVLRLMVSELAAVGRLAAAEKLCEVVEELGRRASLNDKFGCARFQMAWTTRTSFRRACALFSDEAFTLVLALVAEARGWSTRGAKMLQQAEADGVSAQSVHLHQLQCGGVGIRINDFSALCAIAPSVDALRFLHARFFARSEESDWLETEIATIACKNWRAKGIADRITAGREDPAIKAALFRALTPRRAVSGGDVRIVKCLSCEAFAAGMSADCPALAEEAHAACVAAEIDNEERAQHDFVERVMSRGLVSRGTGRDIGPRMWARLLTDDAVSLPDVAAAAAAAVLCDADSAPPPAARAARAARPAPSPFALVAAAAHLIRYGAKRDSVGAAVTVFMRAIRAAGRERFPREALHELVFMAGSKMLPDDVLRVAREFPEEFASFRVPSLRGARRSGRERRRVSGAPESARALGWGPISRAQFDRFRRAAGALDLTAPEDALVFTIAMTFMRVDASFEMWLARESFGVNPPSAFRTRKVPDWFAEASCGQSDPSRVWVLYEKAAARRLLDMDIGLSRDLVDTIAQEAGDGTPTNLPHVHWSPMPEAFDAEDAVLRMTRAIMTRTK